MHSQAATTDDEIGARLRDARTAAGLSLSDMATCASYSRGNMSNVENGRRRPTPNMVIAYERALRTHPILSGRADRRY
ncbi:MAG: helix-turn-helix transcriptional regulator [Actinobacteria bacterium]|nr:helix-turn-helix transcriptional regulator [Actinomycetota bacterium]MBI3688007.1 helix-turn-helix transcriptional regulator [Actinomycetota bacterium]